MRYSEIVEGRDAPLYHLMEHPKAMAVFEADMMEDRWEHNISGRIVKGNSFTRNPKFGVNRPVRLMIDQRKLSQTNKIIPLDGEMVFSARNAPIEKISNYHRDRVSNNDYGSKFMLSEEFVVGPINRLHRYITKISFNPRYCYTNAERIELETILREYCERFTLTLEEFPNTEL